MTRVGSPAQAVFDGMGSASLRITRFAGALTGDQEHTLMKCLFCQADNDRVIDSRAADDGYSIRRRRECLSCLRRYTTYERFDETALRVIKKDRVREPFDAGKLRAGITKACWKRPVSEEQIDRIVAEIQARLFQEYDREVESSVLGELLMEQLKKVDEVAYIRFASVYREFKDAQDFALEMEPMLKSPRQPDRNS
jgi:transcriptional repressor NrdR